MTNEKMLEILTSVKKNTLKNEELEKALFLLKKEIYEQDLTPAEKRISSKALSACKKILKEATGDLKKQVNLELNSKIYPAIMNIHYAVGFKKYPFKDDTFESSEQKFNANKMLAAEYENSCRIQYKNLVNDIKAKKALKVDKPYLGKFDNVYFNLEQLKTLLEAIGSLEIDVKYSGERPLYMENETGFALMCPMRINVEPNYEVIDYKGLE